MRWTVEFLAVAMLWAAGCAEPVPSIEGGIPPIPVTIGRAPPPVVPDVDLVEPTDLVAPTFLLRGAIASGLQGGRGEPSVATHKDATIYVAFPGCDQSGWPLVMNTCAHGPVLKSTDRGQTWTDLNGGPDGKLAADGPNANGDNDVAVDLAGNVYASDLGGGIQSFASYDAGETWTYTGNVVELNPETNARYSSDRNWMAAGRNGHMILAWMGSGPNVTRSVIINTTFDGGQTWLGAQNVSKGMGWLGSVQFHPDLVRAYIPFTVPRGPATPGEGRVFDLRIAFTPDGGYTWEERNTNTTIRASSNGGHFSGMMMAPALDVTQDGHVIYAWSEETLDPVNLNAVGSRVRYIASGDDGLTWTQPVTLSTTENAIMPWVAGGGGDRFAVAYYATDMSGDTDYVPSQWSLEAVVIDTALAPTKLAYTVVDPDVHLGNICARGTGCSTPPVASDRGFLDFFEIDLLPDGNLVIAYTADQVDQASSQEIRFAIQTGGTPLFLVE